MIIQCPSCKTQARLPESHEGSKVRCSECERVYVATPLGAARGSRTKSNTLPIYLAVGGGALLIGVIIMANRGKDVAPAPVVEKEEKVVEAREPVDFTGWKSAPVMAVRELHRAAHAADEAKLRNMIDGKHTWDRAQEDHQAADEAQAEKPATEINAEGETVLLPYESKYDARAWSELAQDEKSGFITDVIERMTHGDQKELIADWRPYDGYVLDESDNICKVEVSVSTAVESESTEGRMLHWTLVKVGERWKAYKWERFYSQGELAELARQRARKTKKKTLSDGSVVYEGEPGPVAHYDDTSAELRAEIDQLYATLIDLELPGPQNAKAKRELVAIGRPALPVLLTGLYLIPLETEDQAIQLNLINQTLSEITGHYTTFKPMVDVGGVGTSEERRQSGIKQWFGWYNRKGKRFSENQAEDLIDQEFQPRNAKEQREYERALKEMEKEKRKQNDN